MTHLIIIIIVVVGLCLCLALLNFNIFENGTGSITEFPFEEDGGEIGEWKKVDVSVNNAFDAEFIFGLSDNDHLLAVGRTDMVAWPEAEGDKAKWIDQERTQVLRVEHEWMGLFWKGLEVDVSDDWFVLDASRCVFKEEYFVPVGGKVRNVRREAFWHFFESSNTAIVRIKRRKFAYVVNVVI